LAGWSSEIYFHLGGFITAKSAPSGRALNGEFGRCAPRVGPPLSAGAKPIQGAGHADCRAVHHVRINHRGLQIGMPQQRLALWAAWALGFGRWGLGVGVWALGFGVQAGTLVAKLNDQYGGL
jgi:hypothetical protein